ncbi:MAG: PKD domain-containing protein, partial [Nanoarchaeota archaeon]
MVMKRLNLFWIILTVIICGIFLAMTVIASTNYLYNTLVTNYSAGDTIKGNVYLSFSQEPVNKNFTSNFQGNISLIDFLEAQSGISEGAQYNCSTQGCVGQYTSQGATTGFPISSGNSKFAGFRITGTGITVNKAGFSVSSNAVASCVPQISIDPLADGQDIFVNSVSGTQSCGTRYDGCYNQANTIEATIIINKEYCEKVTMPAAPAFIVGGEIRNGTTLANLTMKLYDETNGGEAGNCRLPRHTQLFQELNCRINYTTSESRDYYVCITTSNNGGYKIGWETSAPTCGTAEGFGAFNSDFDLFAETIQYAGSPNFVINDSEYEEQYNIQLAEVFDNYLVDVYGRNCQTQPCFLPIRFFGDSQSISLSNALIEYESVGVPASVSGLHALTYEPAIVTGNNLSLDIEEANFVIPITSNDDKFKLFLDGNQLFQKDISIRRSFVLDMQPKVVAFGQNVQFSAIASTNITSTTWSFGDGTSTQTANGSSIVHRYTQTNNSVFELTLTAVNNQGWQATKKFNIYVGDPRELANNTIQDYKRRIENVTAQINTYPSWVIPKIQEILDLQSINSDIAAIENDYRDATTEEDFQNVMLDLIALHVPKTIYNFRSGQALPLAVDYDSVNINYLERIENEDVPDNAELTERAIGWMNEHFSPEISFQHIAAGYDFESEILASVFTIETKPIDSPSDTTYIIFGQDIENAGLYKTNYNIRSISGIGIDYLQLDTSSNKVFEFLLEGEIEIENLGAYIAPEIDALDIISVEGQCTLNGVCEAGEDADNCPEDCSKKWFKFTIIGWIILFFAALILYIILQEWYKHKYQKHLFPDENDLYNLMMFIYNARRSGLNDYQIRDRLSQQGWAREKVNFAFRKIEGKRIGMLEIPLFTHSQHNKTVAKLAT